VILTDRLVSPEIIDPFASPTAQRDLCGKAMPPGPFNAAVNYKRTDGAVCAGHQLVVRLKGGDVSIFSNILDELETLVRNSIAYEIVPGITAALGAAAYVGMPLTARNYATAVRFLTAYKSDVVSANYWKELAKTDDTLVFYMSSETLSNVVVQ
jgi:siroheme synthase